MTVIGDVAGVQWILPEKLLIKLAQSPSSMPDAICKSAKGVHFHGLSKADAAQVSKQPMWTPVMHSYTAPKRITACTSALGCDTLPNRSWVQLP